MKEEMILGLPGGEKMEMVCGRGYRKPTQILEGSLFVLCMMIIAGAHTALLSFMLPYS